MLSSAMSNICFTFLEMLYHLPVYEKIKWEEQN